MIKSVELRALADEYERMADLRAEVARLREALAQYRLPDGHFLGCRRAGLAGEPHDAASFTVGREPATRCSPGCVRARAALKKEK